MKFTLMIVDDLPAAHTVVCNAAQDVERKMHVEVTCRRFFELQKALESAKHEFPDIVVMDFQKQNGWKAAHEIRRDTGAEVIIFTGSPDLVKKHAKDWPLAGVTVVQKPAARQEMRDKLEDAITRHNKRSTPSSEQIYLTSEEFAEELTDHFARARNLALMSGIETAENR